MIGKKVTVISMITGIVAAFHGNPLFELSQVIQPTEKSWPSCVDYSEVFNDLRHLRGSIKTKHFIGGMTQKARQFNEFIF